MNTIIYLPVGIPEDRKNFLESKDFVFKEGAVSHSRVSVNINFYKSQYLKQ
jgi:hypothetical protein